MLSFVTSLSSSDNVHEIGLSKKSYESETINCLTSIFYSYNYFRVFFLTYTIIYVGRGRIGVFSSKILFLERAFCHHNTVRVSTQMSILFLSYLTSRNNSYLSKDGFILTVVELYR